MRRRAAAGGLASTRRERQQGGARTGHGHHQHKRRAGELRSATAQQEPHSGECAFRTAQLVRCRPKRGATHAAAVHRGPFQRARTAARPAARRATPVPRARGQVAGTTAKRPAGRATHAARARTGGAQRTPRVGVTRRRQRGAREPQPEKATHHPGRVACAGEAAARRGTWSVLRCERGSSARTRARLARLSRRGARPHAFARGHSNAPPLSHVLAQPSMRLR